MVFGGVSVHARNTERKPPLPLLAAMLFILLIFLCLLSYVLFVSFPLFPYTHLFSLPIPFFLFHVKPSLSKLFVSVPFCLFSKPKTLHAKARGGREGAGVGRSGIVVKGRLFDFLRNVTYVGGHARGLPNSQREPKEQT